MSFLTVEDIDGAIFSNQGFYWHEVDFSQLPDGKFDWIKVDFLEMKCTVSGNGYHYTIKAHASSWCGLYYTDPLKNIIIHQDGSWSISSNNRNFKLFLYMGNGDFEFQYADYKLKQDETFLNYKELNSIQNILLTRINYGTTCSKSMMLEAGYNKITYTPGTIEYFCGYLLVNLVKTDFQFNCNQTLTVGKVNTVRLGTSADYLPDGDLIGSYTPSIRVEYNNQIIPVKWNSSLNDYVFDIDLTNNLAGNVKFKVIIDDNEVINATSTDVTLQSEYQTITTFNQLLIACNKKGTDIVRLGANINASSNIPISHSIKIVGNGKSINLRSHGFVLSKDITLIAENVVFNNGDTTITQAENTTVELTNCTFKNCTSSNYNQLGSCIFCDVDIDNLETSNDFTTILTDCTFMNNHNCILHGGELTITNCSYSNDDTDYIDINNPAFLYMTDGNAVITGSQFNIEYDTNSLCSNQINIGYAQALIQCGLEAAINGATHSQLQDNNSLPFFEAPNNNRANIYAKYYYPQISACVESIALINGKACCHSVTNSDWVFKNNVQVKRVD